MRLQGPEWANHAQEQQREAALARTGKSRPTLVGDGEVPAGFQVVRERRRYTQERG